MPCNVLEEWFGAQLYCHRGHTQTVEAAMKLMEKALHVMKRMKRMLQAGGSLMTLYAAPKQGGNDLL